MQRYCRSAQKGKQGGNESKHHIANHQRRARPTGSNDSSWIAAIVLVTTATDARPGSHQAPVATVVPCPPGTPAATVCVENPLVYDMRTGTWQEATPGSELSARMTFTSQIEVFAYELIKRAGLESICGCNVYLQLSPDGTVIAGGSRTRTTPCKNTGSPDATRSSQLISQVARGPHPPPILNAVAPEESVSIGLRPSVIRRATTLPWITQFY